MDFVKGLAALVLTVSTAFCVCSVPQPRLVCAEYSNSEAVVVAKLAGTKVVGDSDAFVYSLQLERILVGRVPAAFRIYEQNDSGRASFRWIKGREYLLFMNRFPNRDAWGIDGCGNSEWLRHSSKVLNEVKRLRNSSDVPKVSGVVSTDPWTNGLLGVEVTAVSVSGVEAVKTDERGAFQFRLRPGTYTLRASHAGWLFKPLFLSYENPDKLVLRAGGCAQVQFEGTRTGLGL